MRDPFKKTMEENLDLLQDEENDPHQVLDRVTEFLKGAAKTEEDSTKKTQYTINYLIFDYMHSLYDILDEENKDEKKKNTKLRERIKKLERKMKDLRDDDTVFENTILDRVNKLEQNMSKLTKEVNK